MVVFVFAIEIEQKLTGRGKMEFEDITASLWGFIEFFAADLVIKLLVYLINKAYSKLTNKSHFRNYNINNN